MGKNMSGHDEDDKPTVVLDLNALKKQKLKQEEELANLASELEFAIPEDDPTSGDSRPQNFPVILFDFGCDFFQKSLPSLPEGFDYKIIKTLPELNNALKSKDFQIVAFYYDSNPKAVNQLCAQIKSKMPFTKTLIIAKAISPEKARIHAQTPSGAAGYYQLPIDSIKVEDEFLRIYSQVQKAS
jgi:hypothetical protein